MVKFSEFSVDKVSFLSLESTQKKKFHRSKYPLMVILATSLCHGFFFSFWSDATYNKLLSAKSLALANINIWMPYLDNNVFHNLPLFRFSHAHNSICLAKIRNYTESQLHPYF